MLNIPRMVALTGALTVVLCAGFATSATASEEGSALSTEVRADGVPQHIVDLIVQQCAMKATSSSDTTPPPHPSEYWIVETYINCSATPPAGWMVRAGSDIPYQFPAGGADSLTPWIRNSDKMLLHQWQTSGASNEYLPPRGTYLEIQAD